jgi:hypothetical protein
MRYRLMATYRGVPYEAGIGPSEADVVLFAACPPPEELGFEPATGHWRKQLRIEDVQALWESRPTGIFRGERCIVLDDLGDRLHIAYLGHDAYQAEQLGYWQVDRGVFELITPRDEVVDIVEERTDYPGRAVSMAAPFGAGVGGQPPGSATAPPADYGSGGPLPASALRQQGTAQRENTASTKLADLAAATLAHLATMSHSPARARAQDRGEPAADPLTGLGSEPANGMAARPAGFGVPAAGPGRWPGGSPGSEVAMPPPEEEPLPLEAAARRAASAATAAMRRQRRDPAQAAQDRRDPAAGQRDQIPEPRDPARDERDPARDEPALQQRGQAPEPAGQAPDPSGQAPEPSGQAPEPAASPRRRRTARKRVATQRIFSELASLAAIPPAAYAVGEEVDGAMCLIPVEQGFEVFHAVAGARHEVRGFQDEESAYFYLFGVLAADAVRTGRLAPLAS